MHFYGYARVSTTGQDLTIQREALKAAGCKVIREEKVSGTSRQGRAELDTLLQFIRSWDTLVVTRIDRLARSVADLQDIVRTLRKKGANLLVTEQKVDTSTATGKCFFDMLGVFAEFETNLRRERQMEGIAKAKAKGDVYKGSKGRFTPEGEMNRYAEFLRDDAGTVLADWIALALGILALGVMVVYSIVSEGVSSLTSNARGTLSVVEVGVDAGSALSRYESSGNDSSGTSDPCSFPHICNTSGGRYF